MKNSGVYFLVNNVKMSWISNGIINYSDKPMVKLIDGIKVSDKLGVIFIKTKNQVTVNEVKDFLLKYNQLPGLNLENVVKLNIPNEMDIDLLKSKSTLYFYQIPDPLKFEHGFEEFVKKIDRDCEIHDFLDRKYFYVKVCSFDLRLSIFIFASEIVFNNNNSHLLISSNPFKIPIITVFPLKNCNEDWFSNNMCKENPNIQKFTFFISEYDRIILGYDNLDQSCEAILSLNGGRLGDQYLYATNYLNEIDDKIYAKLIISEQNLLNNDITYFKEITEKKYGPIYKCQLVNNQVYFSFQDHCSIIKYLKENKFAVFLSGFENIFNFPINYNINNVIQFFKVNDIEIIAAAEYEFGLSSLKSFTIFFDDKKYKNIIFQFLDNSVDNAQKSKGKRFQLIHSNFAQEESKFKTIFAENSFEEIELNFPFKSIEEILNEITKYGKIAGFHFNDVTKRVTFAYSEKDDYLRAEKVFKNDQQNQFIPPKVNFIPPPFFSSESSSTSQNKSISCNPDNSNSSSSSNYSNFNSSNSSDSSSNSSNLSFFSNSFNSSNFSYSLTNTSEAPCSSSSVSRDRSSSNRNDNNLHLLHRIKGDELEHIEFIDLLSKDDFLESDFVYNTVSDVHYVRNIYQLTNNYEEIIFENFERGNSLKNQSIAKADFYDLKSGNIYIYFENISSQLSKKIESLGPIRRAMIAVEIAYGMSLAHKHKIFHGNLTPENIFLDSNNHAKICGFGLPFNYRHFMPICDKYTEPDNMPSEKSDIYSFGILLFWLINKSFPFVENTGDVDLDKISQLTELSRKIIKACFLPEELSFEQILRWMENDDFMLFNNLDLKYLIKERYENLIK